MVWGRGSCRVGEGAAGSVRRQRPHGPYRLSEKFRATRLVGTSWLGNAPEMKFCQRAHANTYAQHFKGAGARTK
jgi:hypothetical protein